MIVSTSLPLDPADLGICLIVGERLRNEPPDRVSARSAEVSVGDETTPTRKGHEAQRAVSGDRDCARRLHVRAKLIVIGRKKSSGIVHALTVQAQDECDNR